LDDASAIAGAAARLLRVLRGRKHPTSNEAHTTHDDVLSGYRLLLGERGLPAERHRPLDALVVLAGSDHSPPWAEIREGSSLGNPARAPFAPVVSRTVRYVRDQLTS
jgi:hypothetical protein